LAGIAASSAFPPRKGAAISEPVSGMHQTIVNYLTPMLGEATAQNMIRHYCVRMHLSVEDLMAQHLRELANSMRPMLAVWLGSAGAARVAEEIAQLARGANSR
jgi:hypothetical protein